LSVGGETVCAVDEDDVRRSRTTPAISGFPNRRRRGLWAASLRTSTPDVQHERCHGSLRDGEVQVVTAKPAIRCGIGILAMRLRALLLSDMSENL